MTAMAAAAEAKKRRRRRGKRCPGKGESAHAHSAPHIQLYPSPRARAAPLPSSPHCLSLCALHLYACYLPHCLPAFSLLTTTALYFRQWQCGVSTSPFSHAYDDLIVVCVMMLLFCGGSGGRMDDGGGGGSFSSLLPAPSCLYSPLPLIWDSPLPHASDPLMITVSNSIIQK